MKLSIEIGIFERMEDALVDLVRSATRESVRFVPANGKHGHRIRAACEILAELGRLEHDGPAFIWILRGHAK